VHDRLDRSLSRKDGVLDAHTLDDEAILFAAVLFPVRGPDLVEKSVKIRRAEPCRLDKDALRRPQTEVGPEEPGSVGLEVSPPGRPSGGAEAQPIELGAKYAFEAEGAKGEGAVISFHLSSIARAARLMQVDAAQPRLTLPSPGRYYRLASGV
jgi:hypothetical protein